MTTDNTPEFHELPDGRRIAYRYTDGAGPCLVFLPGYMSDMAGGKATALAEWAAERGVATLLLDYSGCGQSEGDFADGTLTKWRDEVLAVIKAKVGGRVSEGVNEGAGGDIILIGSSMGGWLMLLVGLALHKRLAGMIGIAPAPDFSEWGYMPDQKAKLAGGETIYEDNPYGPEPTPTHAKFWQDAQGQRQLDGEIAIDCPVRLIHGQQDADVPWQISLRLADALRSDDVQVTLIKDGDHRLSRPQDIALLLRTVATMLQVT